MKKEDAMRDQVTGLKIQREEEINPTMVRLSTYMSAAAGRELPDSVVKETKHHILDTIAAMVSGAELTPGLHALRFARAYGGEKISTVVASDMLTGPIEAAMVNGVLANADETDDSVMANLSMQYLIAVMLIDKALSFKAAHDEPRMQDPAVLREKAKIKVIADESLERLLPKSAAIIEITLSDGTTITERNDTVRGSPENPMTSEEVIAKARDLIVPVLGNEKCRKLVESIFALDEIKNIGELRPLLQRSA